MLNKKHSLDPDDVLKSDVLAYQGSRAKPPKMFLLFLIKIILGNGAPMK